jgi:hypothetical protein
MKTGGTPKERVPPGEKRWCEVARSISVGATATAAAAAATAAAGISRPFLAGPGFIDGEGAAFPLASVEGIGGGLGALLGGHGDESEAAWAAGNAIEHQVGFGDGPVLGEEILEIVFSDVVGKISHVQFSTHDDLITLDQLFLRDCPRKPGCKSPPN